MIFLTFFILFGIRRCSAEADAGKHSRMIGTQAIHIGAKLNSPWDGSAYDYSYPQAAGPEFWKYVYPDDCAGSRQSPINLENPEPMACEQFEFTGYDVLPDDMMIANYGSTAKVVLSMSPMPTISGGCLNATYEFLQLHWHWGSSSGKGSEHQIDGSTYSMELHLVHWNTNYGTVEEALTHPDGLAVLGVMINESPAALSGNPYMEIARALPKIRTYKKSAHLQPLQLDFFLPRDTSSYFRYDGSLTTPTCNEIVIWTVFVSKVDIPSKCIKEFRGLKDSFGGSLVNNFRPVQPLNGRSLYLVD